MLWAKIISCVMKERVVCCGGLGCASSPLLACRAHHRDNKDKIRQDNLLLKSMFVRYFLLVTEGMNEKRNEVTEHNRENNP